MISNRLALFNHGLLAFPAAILAFLILSSAVSFSILGFRVTGWAWLGGLTMAVMVLAAKSASPVLPLALWAPWLLMVAIYSFAGFDHSLQSAAQTICPVLVGLAASTLRPTEFALRGFLSLLRKGGILFLIVIVLLRLPMLLLGRLPEVTGLAAEAISSLIFQSLFLCAYLLRKRKQDLVLFLCFAAVPIITVTRGPILGSLMLLLCILAPLKLRIRVLILSLALIAGVAAFHTDRVQKKMFWSGQGTLKDLKWDNTNLIKSGREAMWDELKLGIADQPWFGHGGNADAARLIRAGFPLYLPHNDWLRILYNYGRVGCGLYILAMVGQVIHGLYMARRASPTGRILFFAALSAFVPYATLMMTDNILIYAQFFGNLQFLILGLAYGSLAAPPQIGRVFVGSAPPPERTTFFPILKPAFSSPSVAFRKPQARPFLWLNRKRPL